MISNSSSSFSGAINGPQVLPQAPTHALVMLHGFGSHGDDLITLAPPLKASLGNLGETMAFFSPHAPSPLPEAFANPAGRQWFRDAGWTFRDEQGLQNLVPQLESFLQQLSKIHAIPAQNIALLGFSQGAMSLLYALPQLQTQPAAVIACSGTISVKPTFSANPTTKPPLLFLHGEDDDVLPADCSVEAAALYQSHGYQTELHILPNLGHGIDPRTLAHITVFLQSLWTPETPA